MGKQVKDFLEAKTVFLPVLEESDLVAFQKEEVIDTPVDKAVEPEDLDVDETADEDNGLKEQDKAEVSFILPEEAVLPLPSNIISVELREPLKSLILVERELRKGKLVIHWRDYVWH